MPLRRLASLLLLAVLVALPMAARAAAPDAPASAGLLAPLTGGGAVALPELDPSVPSPAEILGYPLGTRFTGHRQILDYLHRLADASPRVTMWQYGESYEGRPLTLVAISTPENLARLEALRTEHLRLADPRGMDGAELERVEGEVPVVVWLAYGVHGNESSSSEAAMAAAYTFAAAGGDWPELLAGTVILIDPLVNPDGRERYVSFYEQARGRVPDPDPAAAEHREPWPGGRQNHYLIDLNRDWSWASQRETRARLAEYRKWEPQVYADYHEMFSESSYFFPPPAEPVNPLLDRHTVAWLKVFGRANGAAFDRQGWPYYKGETFDLYYPGYGDSYPGFRGAVGMTYEVAGHGRAGLAITRRDGSVLTLADRIARHLTTSIATAETAARNRHDLLATYAQARADAAAKAGPAYLWPADVPEAGALADLLSLHGIEVSQLTGETRLAVHGFAAGEDADQARTFPVGTYVVDAGQPLGSLARALLDRAPTMGRDFLERQRARLERNVGTEFYDITSWSLPLAFNVPEWIASAPGRALDGRLAARVATPPGASGLEAGGGDGRVGFLVPPAGLAGFRFAGALEREGVAFRVALGDFDIGGGHYPSGTLFIPRIANRGEGADPLRATLARLAAESDVRVTPVDTSYSSQGISLGSDLMPSVASPKIGLVSGDGVSPTSFGFLWSLLDQQVRVPFTRLDLSALGATDLADFDVLILPDGYGYGRALTGEGGDAVARWVRRGGVLIAVGGAHGWLREEKLTAVATWKAPQAKSGAGRAEKGEEGEEGEEPPPGTSLSERPIYTPGAIVATRLTPDHPLAVGLPGPPPVLVTGSTVLEPTGDPQVDVLTAAPEAPVVTGMAWPEAEKRLAGSLLVSFERQGRGVVVLFAQEPDFRLFWRGTAPLFLNAALYGPSLTQGDF